jgi:uncharacterized membrane protein YqgA involved in biofilm formation
MIGTIINVIAILGGGVAGLKTAKNFTPARQIQIKRILGILTVWFGLSATYHGLGGGILPVIKQLTILVLSMMIGKALGRGMRLQEAHNRLGQFAKRVLTGAQPGAVPWGEGFITCTILFCAVPLAWLGAVQEGLFQNPRPLLVKSCMDGLSTLYFARVFGWSSLLAGLPVLAWQGTLTLGAIMLQPVLQQSVLLDSLNATSGMLIFSVSLVILELRKVELAEYLPSLAVAPLLTWIMR